MNMKKLVLLSVFIAFISTSCEKQEMYNRLHGNWKILGISGGSSGFESVRNFDGIILNQSGKYTVNYNDIAIQGGSFKIEKHDPIEYGNTQIEFRIHFSETYDNDPYANFYPERPMEVIFFGNDTLTLSEFIPDGFNYHFIRK
jgi:hypothetical protein